MNRTTPRHERLAHVLEARDRLRAIPNVGPATAGDLLRLGIRTREQLAQADPDDLYRRLAELDGREHDPCVRDVFEAAIVIARGGPVRPWWHYSRKRRQAAEGP